MVLDALRCNHLAPLGFKGLMSMFCDETHVVKLSQSIAKCDG